MKKYLTQKCRLLHLKGTVLPVNYKISYLQIHDFVRNVTKNRFIAHGKGIINVHLISAIIKCAVWTRYRASQPTVSTETLHKHCTRQMPRQKHFLHFYPSRAAPHQKVLG